jgi:hypothetical protein
MAKQKRIMVKKAGSVSKPKNKSAVAGILVMAKQKRIMVKKAGSVSIPKNKSAVTETKPTKFKGRAFVEWRKCFEPSLTGEPAARKGFYHWIESAEQIASEFEVPWRDDCRGYVLECIHSSTSPKPALEEKTRKINNYTRTELKKLVSKLEEMTDHLRSIGVIFTTPVIDIDMSPVLKSFEVAARETSKTLKYIDSLVSGYKSNRINWLLFS